jgi:hypothetical protein
MRSLSSIIPFCVVALLGTHVGARPQVRAAPAAKGGGGGGEGGGGEPINGSGIPNVANARNPTCVPFYAIRDAIMGGLFQGGTFLFLAARALLIWCRSMWRQRACCHPTGLSRCWYVPRMYGDICEVMPLILQGHSHSHCKKTHYRTVAPTDPFSSIRLRCSALRTMASKIL